MNLNTVFATNNACYQQHSHLEISGIMLHSTGANNPYLSRYVGPNDGKLGENPNNNTFNQFKPDGRFICPHGFIGKLADNSIATYQTLPWDWKAWHCGSGLHGSGNNTLIGIEICEDDTNNKAYLRKVYTEAAELCAYLCNKYNLLPSSIICHAEGYRLGIATNHADVEHWWHKHGYTMDNFRRDVAALMQTSNTLYRVQLGAFSNKSNAEAYLATVKKYFPDAFITKN